MLETLPIEIDGQALSARREAYGIRRLYLFGSVLRDDFGPESDIDVLVEFEPGQRVGFVRLMRLQAELSALLSRQVDLHTPGSLSPYFRDGVLRSALVILG